MNLRSLPTGLNSFDRCDERRKIIERELGVDLGDLSIEPSKLGSAEEKNCEQMFGHVPIPVGLAGPLKVHFSNDRSRDAGVAATDIYLPLATTEAALVASVNRGCKALNLAGGVKTSSTYHGMTRSLAFRILNSQLSILNSIQKLEAQWKQVGENTSNHLKIISFCIDEVDDHIFLTINCDTDEAMGMNMVTIAAQAIGEWLQSNIEGLEFVTVAGNVDSDKKPSKRTHDLGRGYEVIAEAEISEDIVREVLKSDPESLVKTAHAKLDVGSKVAGSLGSNLHVANIIAALYLATGQDAAHTVEGSLTDTTIDTLRSQQSTINIKIRCPAILVGVRGGGTGLPAQNQCLDLIMKANCQLPKCQLLAESIGAAVLAGEISLLAAQATHTLSKSHQNLAR
ncbi:MAG: hypothetical protein QF755_04730 [Candidatus Peribacteraceae bacterium]|jgi:hydroxymethylglutaryl-CoA reductase (NADPH)|nr:hypothetical protein [Candidatus Peribacteraceae bacterium]HCI03820.1 3-hydroxy-3-methylglutaryl-CoA reductase [Candidatus Peribacteria bacterium]|tara:strand:+ start:3112 stop:4302 length:1191 start_codon:yes stop_codon:yes gene_type:complete